MNVKRGTFYKNDCSTKKENTKDLKKIGEDVSVEPGVNNFVAELIKGIILLFFIYFFI